LTDWGSNQSHKINFQRTLRSHRTHRGKHSNRTATLGPVKRFFKKFLKILKTTNDPQILPLKRTKQQDSEEETVLREENESGEFFTQCNFFFSYFSIFLESSKIAPRKNLQPSATDTDKTAKY